ncbi:hypothetical protein [Butyrivibrio hungatei]|uniref:Uncharacterized protein n=1 Tax=Butyrivibrio hungatei TaxID=185008 RepID=A0A1D9P6X8_9FIRM|nr:hypothetical protein [Butyrivibrio hungatei]AOZ97895.1 hypothetical protein bhn_II096 [Butyrivibrio hungatei]
MKHWMLALFCALLFVASTMGIAARVFLPKKNNNVIVDSQDIDATSVDVSSDIEKMLDVEIIGDVL